MLRGSIRSDPDLAGQESMIGVAGEQDLLLKAPRPVAGSGCGLCSDGFEILSYPSFAIT